MTCATSSAPSTTRRRGGTPSLSREKTAWKPYTLRAIPSRVVSGKNSHAWCRVSQRRTPVRSRVWCWAKTRMSAFTSGSLSMWLGLAWCRLCLSFHHSWLMPSSRLAWTSWTRRPFFRSAVICACPASCPTNAIRADRTARGGASSSVHQEGPSSAIAAPIATSSSRLTVMPRRYQPARRSRRPCSFTIFRSGVKSLPLMRTDSGAGTGTDPGTGSTTGAAAARGMTVSGLSAGQGEAGEREGERSAEGPRGPRSAS